MVDLWSLGGLSWSELAKRAWHESWEDQVFGQAARLAFYHFLAIFPSLLLFMLLVVKLTPAGSELERTLVDSLGQLLPNEASGLVANVLDDLNKRATLSLGILWVACCATWAALNGTWAMIVGLNKAYEVKEERPWWKISVTVVGLTISLATFGLIALVLILYGSRLGQLVIANGHLPVLWRLLQWSVIMILLLISFALLYRFGPNLYEREWRWSTPGAIVALALWIGAAVLLRPYFEHFSSYRRIYGPLHGVAMLLMWLYVTSAAILIGGEVNSEIEKAADHERMSSGESTEQAGRVAHDRSGH